MSVESQFAKVSGRLIRDDRGVERGRMLHSIGLKTAGRFFAFTTKGELVVKLPARRVAELIAMNVGQPCAPRPGRPMREWVRLTPPAEGACAAYVVEARDFVTAQANGPSGGVGDRSRSRGPVSSRPSRRASASRGVGLAPRRPGQSTGGSS
jgi:hypothetical protein